MNMAEKEMQAHDMVRRRSWSCAVALYDRILTTLPSTGVGASSPRATKDRQIACLLGRCECLLELGKYEGCLADARHVLRLLHEQADCLASISRARRWLVHSLCKLKFYGEAGETLREWIAELNGQQSFSDITKTLERYKSIIQMINGQKASGAKMSTSRLEDEMCMLDTKLDHWATNNLPLDKFSKLLSNKGLKKREGSQQQNGLVSSNSSSSSSSTSCNSTALQKTTDLLAAIKLTGVKHMDEVDNATTCTYCAITFQTRNELRQHCQTESHQNVIMSDEGRDWKWRPPPRGFTLDSYSLCEAYTESQTCHYGNQCVEAHGIEELNEWKDRFEYRRMRLQKACEKELYGKSYTEQILERWIQATAPERVMCEKIDDVEVNCEQEFVTSISSKSSTREWVIVIKTHQGLKGVALLQDAHRNHFAIKSIALDNNTGSLEDVELKSNQEWVATRQSDKEDGERKKIDDSDESMDSVANCTFSTTVEHKISIEFHTEIYGTFRQAICFDFGTEPLLVKHLCVDVVPVSDAEKIEEIKRDIINNAATRWDVCNTNLSKFETTISAHLKTEAYLNDVKHEKEMLERYPCPRAATFTLTQSTIVEKRLTHNNYRSRIHELLYVEEIARYEQISRYNVRTKLTVTSNYILTPAGMATSTAKYSLAGELFALMRLGKDLSEDTSAGRLILSSCLSVYISTPENHSSSAKEKKRNVYETMIEDKGKNVIYLKLSTKCVDDLSLKADTDIEVDIQFQLNRLPYCEWHNAVDKITDFKLIFPATDVEPNIPWTPKKQWSDTCEPKLNAKQREAVNAITTSLAIKLPPILLIGPFGTGKTYTLAQAIKQLLQQPEARVLICTHSNSAADLYIKEYLHPWIEEGLEEATPLRVYYHKRWVATVNSVVQKYCITDGTGNFRRPSLEDIMKYRIVVVTLSISMELANMGLPKGYFTHIFLDEAAQAMECEAIMPLALANESTRIVLAGDHMQMSPELFSAFAKERKLHISLLERLYDHYPSNFPCKILLCENYRAHEAIIKFTSELFYEQKLIASGKQPRHDRFYPLTFFTTRGEDIQDKNSTAFYNNAEVYEVVERVSELRKKWPSSWGKICDASIGIMTPYADQVFRIRSELRKRRMGGISVERVLNVQGKQFRAVFLSTVRTRRTCMPLTSGGNSGATMHMQEDADYGFLSNSKLLNTAITRAQSLVAVVGDPIALCSIGRCRKVWERFIEICDENKSLFGITWSYLRSQLDGVELKRGYVLNPLAPEFIPRALQPEAYLRDQTAMYLMGAGMSNSHHGGPHVGAHQNSGPILPHHNMLNASGSGHLPPHHAMANQHMPHMYTPHSVAAAAYNAAAAAAAAMMNPGLVGKGGHHFPGHPGHMNMRGMGPHQTPPPHLPHNQQYPRGPPPSVHLGQQPPPGGQFSPYMHWQQAQLRNGPPGSGTGFPPATQQQGPQSQNPNASLWGPPPQSNPWSVLPKPSLQQPPNTGSGGRQLPLAQQPTPGMRGSSVPIQPPNNQPLRPNPNELNYLAKKTVYGPHPAPTQPHGNFSGYASGNAAPNHLQMLNQRGVSGIANGPISPMEPYMQRPPATGGAPLPGQTPQNNFFGGNNIGPIKDKEFQFLNNVHVPLSFTGGSGSGNNGSNMLPGPPPVPNKQQSPTALRFPQPYDYAALLPPNMSIYEMAFEPKESQYKWYLKVLETHGQEAANKFTDALRHVINMIHTHPQPSKQPPQMPTHLNSNQLMPPREILPHGMPSLMGAGGVGGLMGHQQQQQQQQHRANNSAPPMHPYIANNFNPAAHNLAPSMLTQGVDEAAIDANNHFNQQIDLVFNSLMNGNEISQPILRDLFGMVGVSGGGSSNSNNSANMLKNINNGDLLLAPSAPLGSSGNVPQQQQLQQQQQQQPPQSKMFPVIAGGVGAGGGSGGVGGTGGLGGMVHNDVLPPQPNIQKPPPPVFPIQTAPHLHQQPNQQTPANNSFMGNNAMVNNKDSLFGGVSGNTNVVASVSSSSVPLYRRQAISMGNGSLSSSNSGGQFNNSTTSAATSGVHPSSAPDSGGSNDILVGLTTTSAGNLIEALFQTNAGNDSQNSSNSFQKLLFQNYNATIKPNELDLFLAENHLNSGGSGGDAGNTLDISATAGTTNHHPHAHLHPYHNNIGGNAPGETRNTTYAAVLSQGPQQQSASNHVNAGLHHHNFHPEQTGGGRAATNSGHTGNLPVVGGMEIEKDPFAAIRELGQGTNGFYNYFQ